MSRSTTMNPTKCSQLAKDWEDATTREEAKDRDRILRESIRTNADRLRFIRWYVLNEQNYGEFVPEVIEALTEDL